MPEEDPAVLTRWAPWVRAAAIDFELKSRIGFTAAPPTAAVPPPPRRMDVWHLEVAAGSTAGAAPTPTYRPLFSMTKPADTTFKAQTALVNDYAQLRSDRESEILAQLNGGVGFFSALVGLDPDRRKRTLEMLAATLRLAMFIHLRVKHALACRRPVEFSPQIQPMIATPGHGALPSGHATESFALAVVLWNVMRDSGNPAYAATETAWRTQMLRLSARIAINRTVAGVHFPVDSVAGALLGLTIGSYIVARSRTVASGDNAYQPWAFDGTAGYPDRHDFRWYQLYDVANEALLQSSTVPPFSKANGLAQALPRAARSPLLTWLWEQAASEWK
jgi:membrane-associated phospholipid phosphatase